MPDSARAAPRGPRYSWGIQAGDTVFVAGMVANEPATGQWLGGDIAVQTKQVMKNLQEVLLAAGSSLRLAMRCDVFLIDLADFDAMNEVYANAFDSSPPARVTVQVSALPKGARVEIAAIADVLE